MVVVVAALVARFAYEGAARDVVEQRDTELARISAARLSERLSNHSSVLQSVAAEDTLRTMDLAGLAPALKDAGPRLNEFDAGVFVFDAQGSIVWPAVSDYSSGLLAQGRLETVRRTLRPAVSDVFRLERSGDDLITILVPIMNHENQFGGALAGVSNIRTSLLGATLLGATFAEVLELKAGQSGFAYLVDSNGKVIYHRDISLLGRDLTAVAPVSRSIGGNTGAVISQNASGQEVISGYAPVPGTGWALVTQENWSKVLGPLESRSVWLLLLLAGGGLLSGALIFVAIGRTLGPIKQLTRSARRIAEGDFDHAITASSGDEIETLAEQFNVMAGALKESYAELENRVEARTGELLESEERYRALFEESRDAIFVSSPEGKVVAANQAALELFDFPLEEAIGSDLGDRFVDPLERDRFRQVIGQTGSVKDFDLKLRKRDGTQIDCLLTATRRLNQAGRDAGLLGSIRDITESNLAEEAALQQSREMAVLGERNRMAREIHDTLAQGLTGIVIQLEAGEQALGDSPTEVASHLDRARSLARENLQ